MHTIRRDYDRVPFSPNFSNLYSPSQLYSQAEMPTHEDVIQPVEELVRIVPLRNGTLQGKQEYDSPQSLELEEDSLLNTIIVGKDTIKGLDRPTEVEYTANLPSEIANLIISLETLSQSLSISHKQLLSHQLTRLSYSLQTDCLKPEIEQKWEAPVKTTPSPPPITPRSSNVLPFPPPSQEHPSNPAMFTGSSINTDWSGPGSFPTYDQRPTQLDVNIHNRSASVQYEPNVPLTRQVSQEIIYANTGSPNPKIGTHSPLAPPLPPRDHFGAQVEYQNIPASRASKNKKTIY